MMSQILIMLQTELRIFPLPPNRIDLLSTTHPTAKSWELLSPSPPGTYGWPRLLLSPAKYLVTVTTSLHSSRPKLPSSFIWTYSEVCFFSKPCLFLPYSSLHQRLCYYQSPASILLPWTTPPSLCCCQADCLLVQCIKPCSPSLHWPPSSPTTTITGASVQFSSVAQSCLTLCDPWTAACQASLSITNSWSPPKPMSIVSVMPSNYLILCCPLPLLPSIFPSQWVRSSHQVAKNIGVSASTSVLPMNTQDWSPLGWTGWILLTVQVTLKRLL